MEWLRPQHISCSMLTKFTQMRLWEKWGKTGAYYNLQCVSTWFCRRAQSHAQRWVRVCNLVVYHPQHWDLVTWEIKIKEMWDNRWSKRLITHSSQIRPRKPYKVVITRLLMFGVKITINKKRIQGPNFVRGGRRTIAVYECTRPIYIDVLFLAFLLPCTLVYFFHVFCTQPSP